MSTCSLFAYNDGSSEDVATYDAANTYSDAVRKAHADKMTLTFTGNKLYNTTDEEFTDTMGSTLYGTVTAYPMKELKVSDN